MQRHQKDSAPVMAALKERMLAELEDKRVGSAGVGEG